MAPRRNPEAQRVKKQVAASKRIRKRMPPPTKVHRPTKHSILDRAQRIEAEREIEEELNGR